MSHLSWSTEADDTEDIASGLAAILGPRGLNMPPEVLERHVTGLLGRLSPADSENFTNALKSVGKFATSNEVRGFAAAALPIAGTAVGAAFGGPIGASLGGTLGGAAAQAVAPGRPTARAAASGPVAMPTASAAPAAPSSAQGGSAAAAQLLSVVQNPALLSSLLALVMGQNGKTSVPLSGSGMEIPVGAMMNLIGTLANRAAEDAEEILTAHGDAIPDYLFDEGGCLACDPAVSSQRADALLRVLAADAEASWDRDAESAEGDDWPESDWY